MTQLFHRFHQVSDPDDWDDEAGMTTAEYAVGTVAACAFAAVLLKVVSSKQVLDLLTSVVTRALHAA